MSHSWDVTVSGLQGEEVVIEKVPAVDEVGAQVVARHYFSYRPDGPLRVGDDLRVLRVALSPGSPSSRAEGGAGSPQRS